MFLTVYLSIIEYYFIIKKYFGFDLFLIKNDNNLTIINLIYDIRIN